MLKQTEINFDVPPIQVHTRENNRESENNLNERRKEFVGKCKEVLDKLCKGERLTVLQCAIDGISSLPRRIADLRENNIVIEGKELNEDKFYTYWMNPEEIARVKSLYRI